VREGASPTPEEVYGAGIGVSHYVPMFVFVPSLLKDWISTYAEKR
jgi:hypothetical protein